jgi:hypothetical protein
MRALEINEIEIVSGGSYGSSNPFDLSGGSSLDTGWLDPYAHPDRGDAMALVDWANGGFHQCTRADAEAAGGNALDGWNPQKDALAPVVTLPGPPGMIARIVQYVFN